MNSTKRLVDQLIYDMKHRHDDFVCDQFYFRDKKTDTSYWVASCYYRMEAPYAVDFGYWNGRRFGKALGIWKADEMIRKSHEAHDKNILKFINEKCG